MKSHIKKITPKIIHRLYNRSISKWLIKRRLGKWFDLEWKTRAASASGQEWRDVYDESWANWDDPDLAPLDIRKISDLLIPGSSVVDIGCGDGFLLEKLVTSAGDLYGVDISKAALFKARDRLQDKVRLMQAFMENLPIENNGIDTVVTTHTLEHILDLKAGIAELKRIASKRLIILVPVQEYNTYTEDYHLQFFMDRNTLLSAVGIENANCITYSNPAGNYKYSGEILLLWADL